MDQAGHGRDVDDMAEALLLEHFAEVFAAAHHAHQVDVDHPVPVFQRTLIDVAEGGDAGIVHHHIDALPARQNRIAPLQHVTGVAYIAVLIKSVGRQGFQLGQRFLAAFLIDVGNRHFPARTGKPQGQRLAQTTTAARDRNCFFLTHKIPVSINYLYLFNSTFAIRPRCTSSGPSASRSTRAQPNMAASGKSSLTPPPPCTWIAASITFCATFGATTLMAEISVMAPNTPTVSIR